MTNTDLISHQIPSTVPGFGVNTMGMGMIGDFPQSTMPLAPLPIAGSPSDLPLQQMSNIGGVLATSGSGMPQQDFRRETQERRPSLFVGGLPREWGAEQVKQFLMDNCPACHGQNPSVYMKKGYCFVNFRKDGIAEALEESLNGLTLEGKKIGVRVQTRENHTRAKDEKDKKRKAEEAASQALIPINTTNNMIAQPAQIPAPQNGAVFQPNIQQWDNSALYGPVQGMMINQTALTTLNHPIMSNPQQTPAAPFYNAMPVQQLPTATNQLGLVGPLSVAAANNSFNSVPPPLSSSLFVGAGTGNTPPQQLLEESQNTLIEMPESPSVQIGGLVNTLPPVNAHLQQVAPLDQGTRNKKNRKNNNLKKVKPSVFVGGLRADITEREIKNFFGVWGKINHVTIKEGFAFIDFVSDADAMQAVSKTNGYLYDGKQLGVRIQTEENRKMAQDAKKKGENVSLVFRRHEEHPAAFPFVNTMANTAQIPLAACAAPIDPSLIYNTPTPAP